jgi:hypothetical protein
MRSLLAKLKQSNKIYIFININYTGSFNKSDTGTVTIKFKTGYYCGIEFLSQGRCMRMKWITKEQNTKRTENYKCCENIVNIKGVFDLLWHVKRGSGLLLSRSKPIRMNQPSYVCKRLRKLLCYRFLIKRLHSFSWTCKTFVFVLSQTA